MFSEIRQQIASTFGGASHFIPSPPTQRRSIAPSSRVTFSLAETSEAEPPPLIFKSAPSVAAIMVPMETLRDLRDTIDLIRKLLPPAPTTKPTPPPHSDARRSSSLSSSRPESGPLTPDAPRPPPKEGSSASDEQRNHHGLLHHVMRMQDILARLLDDSVQTPIFSNDMPIPIKGWSPPDAAGSTLWAANVSPKHSGAGKPEDDVVVDPEERSSLHPPTSLCVPSLGRASSMSHLQASLREPSISHISTHVLVTGEEEETGNKLINQYVVLDDIGSGACGKVKLAFCLKRNVTVAIKVVRRTAAGAGGQANDGKRRSLGRRLCEQEEALRREVALMKKLRHPNVVPLYEVIDDPRADKLYLVMKYAEQGAVGSVRPDGACTHLALARVVDVALQVGKGLRYLHEHGIVHRDIKPENILSTTEGRVMIADFGVSGLEEGADGAGTPLFMAPELHAPPSSASLSEFAFPVGGAVGHTDMWALGVTLYGLLYGQLPFRSIGEVQRAVVARLPTPPCDDAACREQRAKWVACVGLLLSKAADRRPTADAFVAATKALRGALCASCQEQCMPLRRLISDFTIDNDTSTCMPDGASRPDSRIGMAETVPDVFNVCEPASPSISPGADLNRCRRTNGLDGSQSCSDPPGDGGKARIDGDAMHVAATGCCVDVACHKELNAWQRPKELGLTAAEVSEAMSTLQLRFDGSCGSSLQEILRRLHSQQLPPEL